jgi:hypothetical protein
MEKMHKLVVSPVVGKVVTRWLAGEIPMDLTITELTDDRIICGDWTFHRTTGAEIDEYLGWGPPPLMTGSFLTEKE